MKGSSKAPFSDATFRSLLEAAPDAVIIVDSDGKVVFANSQTAILFGYAASDLVGRGMEVLLPAHLKDKHREHRAQYHKRPVTRPMGNGFELAAVKADGTEFPVEVSLSPLTVEGSPLVITSVRDVSRRKKIEQELRSAREAADSANRFKTEFLANMSHEIRTPLAGVLGYAEMLIQYAKTDDERKDFAAKIKRNADTLAELINDILDLSKVEAGALKVERVPLSPTHELENVLSLLQPRADAKGLRLETSVERPIPPLVNSDPTRLRQILSNMIGNALKFTETGKVGVRLRAFQKEGKAYLEYSVEDTGCGISKDAQGLLFHPFVQADSSTTRKYGGTGLGLALSRRLARALGGDLQLVRSEPGKGSLFVATVEAPLPSPVTVEEREPLAKEPRPPVVQGNALEGVAVLVVEDNGDNAQLVSQLLVRQGAEVAVARNGAEGVALAQRQRFHVVLMDVQMPVLDGVEATRRLRREGYGVPILCFTAHALVEERERCLAAGATEFLTKPLDLSVLLARVIHHAKGGGT